MPRQPVTFGPCVKHNRSNVLNMVLPEDAVVLHRWIPGGMVDPEFLHVQNAMDGEAFALIGAPVVLCMARLTIRQDGTGDGDMYRVYARMRTNGVKYREIFGVQKERPLKRRA